MCDSLGSCDPPLVLSSSPAPRMIFTGWGSGLVETRCKWPGKILKMKLSVKNKWYYLQISYLLISMNSCLFSAIVLLLFPLSSIILRTKIANTVCARICYKSNLLQTGLLHSSTEIVWLYLVSETSRKKQSSVCNYSIPQQRELLCAFLTPCIQICSNIMQSPRKFRDFVCKTQSKTDLSTSAWANDVQSPTDLQLGLWFHQEEARCIPLP